MPKLSFNPDKEVIQHCENCIFSHQIKCGNVVFHECFPVKEYSSTQKAIDNCKVFYNPYKSTRDVYVATLVYILYPKKLPLFENFCTPTSIIKNINTTITIHSIIEEHILNILFSSSFPIIFL